MYRVYLLPKAQKDLDAFRGELFEKIQSRILSLTQDPRPPGSIKLTADEGYRLRSGNYRIVYRINDREKIVYIYRIRHRKDIYRQT